MRIAFVGLRGVPAEYSGIEKAVEELSIRLVNKGHHVTVYAMGGRYTNKAESYKGINLHYVPTIKSKNLEMICYAFLSSISSTIQNYDICHFHAIGPSTMSFIPKLFGKKTVVTVHGLDWQREKWGICAKAYLKFGEFTSVNFPHKTIVVSKTLKKYYENKYHKEVIYQPNGIDIPVLSSLNDAAAKFSIQSNKYLLYVGRLTREKNLHILIEAFKRSNTDLKLLLVGGSSHTDDYITELKTLANADNRIVFTGPLYDKQLLSQIYSNAFLFILPSNLEGLPIVLLEALSFGNAVLVSDIPENIEVIQNGDELFGFTFKTGEVEHLQNVLNDLVNNSNQVFKMKEIGKSLVASKYNWNNICNDLERIYKDLIIRF